MTVNVDNLATLTIAGWSPGWRPIQTAPKSDDEISIHAVNARVSPAFHQIVYWQNGRWHVDDAKISYHPDFFTHWQPLPEPPNA